MKARACGALGLLAALACATGCGAALAPAFDAGFPDNDPERSATIAARMSRASETAPEQAPLLVATTDGDQPSLLAYDLAQGRVRWRVALRAESRPELLMDLVVSSADSMLVAFDRESGRLRFRTPLTACDYLGAARDAERLFVACRVPGKSPRGRVLAIDAHNGDIVWTRDAQGEVGRPAARAGVVLVPWQRQNLVALDARDGARARAPAQSRRRDRVGARRRARRVLRSARDVPIGRSRLQRYGGGENYLGPRGDALPAAPPAMDSAFAAAPGGRSARGRISLYVEPEAVADDRIRVAHDRYYFVFYRYVFAYDAEGHMRWSRLLDHDAIAGQAVAQGLALALENGQVLLLSEANGALRMSQSVGVALGAATLQATGASASIALTSEAPDVALRHGLTAIALDTDTRLVPARAYAVQQLSRLADPEVTRELLDIYAQSSTPPDLKRAAADALRTRRSGLAYLVDALLARYDFLEQTRPAPLSVIVPALVDAHETRAVPNLLACLFDEETPSAVLPALVRAIGTLGDDSVAEPLLKWLRMYRADSSFAEDPEALLEAARAVLAHGGATALSQLQASTSDGRANAALVAGIAALSAERDRVAEPVATIAAPAPAVESKLPDKLDQGAVNEVFATHTGELRACAADEATRNPKLSQIRIAFIAESDGSTHALSFVPNTPELADCLYANVSSYRFPRFESGRQVATYTLALREPAAPPQVTPIAPGAAAPWWAFYASRAPTPAATPGAEPWWRSHQPLAPQVEAGSANTAPSSAAKNAAVTPAAAGTPAVIGAAESTAAPASAAVSTTPPASEEAWWLPAGAPSVEPTEGATEAPRKARPATAVP